MREPGRHRGRSHDVVGPAQAYALYHQGYLRGMVISGKMPGVLAYDATCSVLDIARLSRSGQAGYVSLGSLKACFGAGPIKPEWGNGSMSGSGCGYKGEVSVSAEGKYVRASATVIIGD